MAFNRDRFQAAKLEVNKKVTDEVEKTFKSNSQRGDYHSIDDGRNYFRMMPPHNSDEPSMQAKVIYWLDCKVEETIDDKPTGKYVIKPRPIFDSRIHGSTPKDIIDEYIQFTKRRIFANIQDKDEKGRLLAPINGWRDKSGKWNPGILANQSFVCYATKGDIKSENLGRLELWKSDKETLEQLNITEMSDEPIVTDMFSDPNDGVRFVITKGVDSKGKRYTLVAKDTFDPKGAKDITKPYKIWQESQIVPDEVLIKLDEMEPLSKQFKNTYKKSDFERAVDALEMFDKKHGYDTFGEPEFVEIINEISEYYSNETIDSPTKEKSVDSNILDINDMTREELKQYIKDNNLSIRVVASMSEDIIREMIVETELEDGATQENNLVDTTETEDLEKSFEESVETPVVESLKERIARLKAQK